MGFCFCQHTGPLGDENEKKSHDVLVFSLFHYKVTSIYQLLVIICRPGSTLPDMAHQPSMVGICISVTTGLQGIALTDDMLVLCSGQRRRTGNAGFSPAGT